MSAAKSSPASVAATAGAAKRIVKRSGLVSAALSRQPPAGSLSGRDVSEAARRLPSLGSQIEATLHQRVLQGAGTALERVSPRDLVDSPYQPRRRYEEDGLLGLAESLKHRQIDPVLYRQRPDGAKELVSGHRRQRAAMLADLPWLDARRIECSDDEARVLVLAANEPREDFTDFERALAYRSILDADGSIKSIRQLAGHIGIDPSLVSRRLKILDLPRSVLSVLETYPAAFSCRWVSKLEKLVADPRLDHDLLEQTLVRVATGEVQMTAVFPIMACAEATSRAVSQPASRSWSLQQANRLFAQVTPHEQRRLVTVKLPGSCDVGEVAQLLHSALAERFGLSTDSD